MEAVRPGNIRSAARASRLNVLNRLAERDALTEADARHVASVIEKSDEPLDQILCKLGLLTEDRLAAEYASIFDLERFDRKSAASKHDWPALNRRFLYERRVAPVRICDRSTIVSVVDPSDREALDGLAFALEREIVPVIATPAEFDQFFAAAFPEDCDEAAAGPAIDASADVTRLKDMASSEPVVRYVDRLITDASQRRASDIHIEPGPRRAQVKLRIDGRLEEHEALPAAQALSVISRLKILADLDIAEQRRPQDGRMSFPVAGRAIDLRLSTTPTINGESLVVRLLDRSSAPLDLSALGFSDETTMALKSWIAQPNGIVLLTGPTGSGKTTTLYTLLSMLMTGERKILAIEDPVEYRLTGVNQTQVNPAIGLGFAEALRSFLRHDPDVIMVGEMRDAETARIAMRAALTGHLVLSTLHTNDAPSAVTRLLDMGVEDYLVASTVLGVVGQRLVRRLCLACAATNPELERPVCSQCHGAKYFGRTVISEAIALDDAVCASIKAGARAGDVRAAAKGQGYMTMSEDGARKAAAGVTTIDEVRRAIG